MRRIKRWKLDDLNLHSKFEYDIAMDLKNKGVDFAYEAETFKYTVEVPHTYCKECGDKPALKTARYTPDFRLPNGIIVESKGRWTSEDRKKIAAMYEQYPDMDLRMLFKSNNWLTKNHKESYSSWCDKRGIRYHVGNIIPQEWIDE